MWCARDCKSLIDYIIITRKLSSQIRVFTGNEVLLKIDLLLIWRKINPTHVINGKVLKVYLLQEDSLRILYQSRLSAHLQTILISQNTSEKSENIGQAIKKVSYKVLGNKKQILTI